MMKSLFHFSVIFIFLLPSQAFVGANHGVFQYIIREAEGNPDQIARAITGAASGDGWVVAGTLDAGAPKDCPFKSRVIVLFDSTFSNTVLSANSVTGPFCVIDRVNIFQDEQGTHISVVNPHSIIRTVLMNDEKYLGLAESHLQKLRALILSVVKGKSSDRQYGEFRDEGYIGKTMGVIAGGRFDEKLVDLLTLQTTKFKAVVDSIAASFNYTGSQWGLHMCYRIAPKPGQLEILGISGNIMEGKSFDIVGAGSDDSRGDDKCPGLAHAGAYPLELVVFNDGNSVHVRIVDAMFRMKMYFEDAGKWAFMKNMSMPGSIKDEILEHLKPANKQY
jgi:hypothetical protein